METEPVNVRPLWQQLAICSLVVALSLSAAHDRAFASESLPLAEATTPGVLEFEPRIAAWPSWLTGRRPLFNPTTTLPDTPHPAVARIIVPEEGATAYGSGTLIDVRDQFGLVITNWHVVRESQGTVEVVFPNGFRSQARPLKVDADWDLAALVIWRPTIEPVHVSPTPPRPGDLLTIHGYGQGQYRIATGHCTQYFAPKTNFPTEMVELDVEARQGDSGGPIFNHRGELAGVLFGAGEGTTIGSFAPRVESFLATLAPDIGDAKDQTQLAVGDRAAPAVHPGGNDAVSNFLRVNGAPQRNDQNQLATWPSSTWTPAHDSPADAPLRQGDIQKRVGPVDDLASTRNVSTSRGTAIDSDHVEGRQWIDGAKSALAVVGLVAVAIQLVRFIK